MEKHRAKAKAQKASNWKAALWLTVAVTVSVLLAWMTSASAQNVQTAESKAAQMVIDGQFKAFRAQDHDGAFSYAAPTLRKMFGSTDRFIGMVKGGYNAIYGAQRWEFGRHRTRSGALYQEVMLVGPLGRNWVALYTMRKQSDGTWKIAGVQIKETDNRST
ncbi:MAG: DUF4864 domain-containing protein [Pseudomonadota bacterium]